MTFTAFFSTHVSKYKLTASGQATGCCPLHEDRNPSLSMNVEEGLWKCHGCGESGNAYQLAERLNVNLPERDTQNSLSSAMRLVSEYVYEGESSCPLFKVGRYLQPDGKKTFRQFRFENGVYIPNMSGVRRVLYKLPAVLSAQTVIIAEGEKDVETLCAWGCSATCNVGGALKWKDEYSETLKGKHVVILPDQDDVGQKHCNQIVKSLWGKAASIKIINVPKGKDISEAKELGFTKEELQKLIDETPALTNLPQPQNNSTNDFILTSLGDLLDEPEEEINWIVDGLLAKGGLSLLVAKPKTGKSTLARQLTLAVARGESFLGRSTVQGTCVYLAFEERRADVRAHFKQMGANGKEAIQVYAGMAPQDVTEKIRTAAEQTKPILIVVDTLARATKISDLNDYIKVVEGLKPLLALAREVGSHVCLLHHGKKGESKGIDSALGSTGIVATVDTIIEINRSEKYRTIASIQRMGEDIPETVLDFDTLTRFTHLGASKEQTENIRLENSIIDFLKGQESPVNEPTIDEAVEGNRGQRKRALRQLVNVGKIVRTGEGKKGSSYLYALQNTGFVVLPIASEPENQNLKSNLIPQNQSTNSGSDDFIDPYDDEERKAIQEFGGG